MEDLRTRVDADALATIGALVAADMATRFGQTVDAEPTEMSFSGDAGYATLAIEQNFGAFAMIVTSASVQLRAEPCEDGSTWVNVSLRYQHPGGGRNGSTIGTWWVKDGQITDFRGA